MTIIFGITKTRKESKNFPGARAITKIVKKFFLKKVLTFDKIGVYYNCQGERKDNPGKPYGERVQIPLRTRKTTKKM